MITVFDIETKLNEDAFERLAVPYTKTPPEKTEFDPDTVKLGAMKDPAKIEAKIEACRKKHYEDQEAALAKFEADELSFLGAQRDKATLYPAVSTICAIGVQVEGHEPVEMIVGDNIEDEAALLYGFKKIVMDGLIESQKRDGQLKFGFWSGNSNIHQQFDMNHIVHALMRNGMQVPGEFHPKLRYFVDLAEGFFMYGPLTQKMDSYPAYLSLDNAVQIAGSMGQPADTYIDDDGKEQPLIPVPKDSLEVAGATFAEWLDAGDFEKCRDYLRNDIALTRAVAQFQPFLS